MARGTALFRESLTIEFARVRTTGYGEDAQ
jgi:hypothetical protein